MKRFSQLLKLVTERSVLYLSLPADFLPLCLSAGGSDERPKGSRQRGGLALQSGGRHVHLAQAPLQGRHRRLPGEVQRGVGGGRTPVAGKCVKKLTKCFFTQLLVPPPAENLPVQVRLPVCPLGGAHHLSDDVVQRHGLLFGRRPRPLCRSARV